jgi:hypothetical protein
MPQVSINYMQQLRNSHPVEFWTDVQRCPGIQLHANGSANIDDHSVDYLNLLRKWRGSSQWQNKKPVKLFSLSYSHILQMAKQPSLVVRFPFLKPLCDAPPGCIGCGSLDKEIWLAKVRAAVNALTLLPVDDLVAFKKYFQCEKLMIYQPNAGGKISRIDL